MGEAIELIEARNLLLAARETALSNAAVHRDTWVGDIGSLIAGVANTMMHADAPLIALDDAKVSIRHLLRAQRILGHLDGTYPTDRYSA